MSTTYTKAEVVDADNNFKVNRIVYFKLLDISLYQGYAFLEHEKVKNVEISQLRVRLLSSVGDNVTEEKTSGTGTLPAHSRKSGRIELVRSNEESRSSIEMTGVQKVQENVEYIECHLCQKLFKVFKNRKGKRKHNLRQHLGDGTADSCMTFGFMIIVTD